MGLGEENRKRGVKPEIEAGKQIIHITNLQEVRKRQKSIMRLALCNLPGFYPSVELRHTKPQALGPAAFYRKAGTLA